MTPNALLVGLAGGIASALLFAAVLGGGALAAPLFALSPLTIAIAGLGWGSYAGLSAAIAAAALLGAFAGPLVGVIHLALAGLPVAWYAHQIGLARLLDENDPAAGLQWYPLARVFASVTLVTPAALIVTGSVLGFTVDELAQNLADALIEMSAASGSAEVPDRDQLLQVATFYVRLMPVSLAMLWVGVMSLDLWLAGRIVAKSGRLRRPWEDLPTAIGLPPALILVFGVAFFLALGDGALALAAGTVAGALGIGFALVGFATIHVMTQGNPARSLILGALYTLTILFSLPLIPIAALGMADSVLGLRQKRINTRPKT